MTDAPKTTETVFDPWLDAIKIRERRLWLRDFEYPVLSGLHSADPMRKIRIEWLYRMRIERMVGCKRAAWRNAMTLRSNRWKAVLP